MDVITTRELKERLEALTGQEVLLRGCGLAQPSQAEEYGLY